MIRQLPADVQSYLRSGVAITSVTQCVEELFLNALDAGANCVAVRVDLEAFKVQVVDNGLGVPADQLTLLGERYSTSKCHLLTDLDNLCYYGYRGEALASVRDSCGILEIMTRTEASVKTYCKLFQNGRALKVTESTKPRPSVGTTVTVHDLFSNFPVRRKSTNTGLELEKIRQRLQGLALLKPDVSVSLRNDLTGNVILQTHKCSSTVKTFSSLFGLDKAKSLVEVSGSQGHFSVKGFIGKAAHPKKDMQFVYINERVVLKTKIHKSVNQAMAKSVIFRRSYGQNVNTPEITQRQSVSTSPTKFLDKHPFYVLDVQCPLTEYDITFDPSKTLVEFKHWDQLLQCITDVVNTFLKKENLTASPDLAVTTADGMGMSDKIDREHDSEMAAGRISPSMLKGTLTSKKVKRQVTEPASTSKDIYKTPHTMSIEEWKTINQVKTFQTFNSGDTNSALRSMNDTESDKTGDSDVLASNDTTSMSNASEDNTNTLAQVSGLKGTVSEIATDKKNEFKEIYSGKGKQRPFSSVNKLYEASVLKPNTGILHRNVTATCQQNSSGESSTPQSSLSLYRKAVGKPCTAMSNVSVESSVKKVSTLFPEHNSKHSLSSLQRFRKGPENIVKMKSTAQGEEVRELLSKDASLSYDPVSGVSADVQPASLKALQKISAEYKSARQQVSSTGDQIGNRQSLVHVQNGNSVADDNAQIDNSETKQLERGMAISRESRKRLNEIRDPCKTTAAKLSRLVYEKTSSVTIDPDPLVRFHAKTSLDDQSLQAYQHHGQNLVDIPSSSISYHTPDIRQKAMANEGNRSASRDVLRRHEAHDTSITYRQTAPSLASFNPSLQRNHVEINYIQHRPSATVKECRLPSSGFIKQTGVTGTGQDIFPDQDNEDFSKGNDEEDSVIYRQIKSYQSSAAVGDGINTDRAAEVMDTQETEPSGTGLINMNENEACLFTAESLNLHTVETVSDTAEQYVNTQDTSVVEDSEQFCMSTQPFSPKLSQSSLNNEMTKISLSQGFTPVVADMKLDDDPPGICKTPESEGFSPQLDCSSQSSDMTGNPSSDQNVPQMGEKEGKVDEFIELDSQDRQEQQDKDRSVIHSDIANSGQYGTESLQNSPDTLVVTIANDTKSCRKEIENNELQISACSPNFTSEDVSVTQLLEPATVVKAKVSAHNNVKPSGDNLIFSDIFSPSQSDRLVSSLCDQCHDSSGSPDEVKTSQELPNQEVESEMPNASWNTTWSSINENENSKIDNSELDDTYLDDKLKTQTDCKYMYYDKNVDKGLTECRKGNYTKDSTEHLTTGGGIQGIPAEEEESSKRRKVPETLNAEYDGRTAPETKAGCQELVSDSSNVTKAGPGQWMEMTDPATGKQMFLHSKSGASVYGDNFKGNHPQDRAPVRLERLFHAPGSVRLKPGTSSTAGPTPRPGSSVAGMVEEFLERDEEDAEVKWRSPRARDQAEPEKQSSIDTLFQEWSNPILDCPSKEVTTAEVSGLPSRAVVNAYKSMHTCTFTKDMLENVQVIGQLDKKFIACLIRTAKQNVLTDTPDLLAVIDQHAAHERIRLEMLTEEACVDGNRDRGQLCLYSVTPAKVITFTEDEVRIMGTYREEFKRIGILFQMDLQSRAIVHVQSVPECLVVKGEPGGKRKEDFIYWNTIEALIKDHVELLRSTSGAKGRFPKVIHRILCSLACHGAIKFGDSLKREECEALIKDLSQCDLPFQCAHGRPSVMPVLQLEQLETRLPQQKPKKPQLYKLTQALMSGKDT